MKTWRSYWKNSGGIVVSMFTLAAILPVVLAGVLSHEPLRLSSSADQPRPLRIWLEPESVMAVAGTGVEFEVMAEYESDVELIPKVDLSVNGQPLKFERSFSGQTSLGKVVIEANSKNTIVEVDEGSVFTSLPNLPIETNHSTIILK